MIDNSPFVNMLKSFGILAIGWLGAVSAQGVNTSLPVVDLGYQLHRASGFNVSILPPPDAIGLADLFYRKLVASTTSQTSAMAPLRLEI